MPIRYHILTHSRMVASKAFTLQKTAMNALVPRFLMRITVGENG